VRGDSRHSWEGGREKERERGLAGSRLIPGSSGIAGKTQTPAVSGKLITMCYVWRGWEVREP